MRRWVAHISALFVCLWMVPGCNNGDKLEPVSGSVLVDGKPASGALVMFLPDPPGDLKASTPTATCAADGTFQMFTSATGGVRAGHYVVTIVWPDPNFKITDAQRMMGARPADAPDLLAGRYATREKSTIKVEVKTGENKLSPFSIK